MCPNGISKLYHRLVKIVSLFQNLGLFSVKRINDYFLIPHLGVGGSLSVNMRNAYLLDTDYKLETRFNGSATYVTKMTSSVQRDREGKGREGHLTVQLIHEHELIAQLASTQCETTKGTRQLQRWLLASFPDTTAEYLFPEKRKLVELT